MKRFGMVLTFENIRNAQKARRLLFEAGLVDSDVAAFDSSIIRSPDAIHEYNPDEGGPVWYIP